MADINRKYVLHYAVRGYASGETPTIDIYDTSGTKEVNSKPMTEMQSTGIYYYNWFPRKRTTYVVVMNCSAKPRQMHQVVRIEQQKLAGAIRFPTARFPEPTFKKEDKKKIFAKLNQLPFFYEEKFVPLE